MNGMLPDHGVNRDIAGRQHDEALERAAMGRLGREARPSVGAVVGRRMALAPPIVALLALLVVILL
jgi:hypothetical protein